MSTIAEPAGIQPEGMMEIITDEISPISHGRGHDRLADRKSEIPVDAINFRLTGNTTLSIFYPRKRGSEMYQAGNWCHGRTSGMTSWRIDHRMAPLISGSRPSPRSPRASRWKIESRSFAWDFDHDLAIVRHNVMHDTLCRLKRECDIEKGGTR